MRSGLIFKSLRWRKCHDLEVLLCNVVIMTLVPEIVGVSIWYLVACSNYCERVNGPCLHFSPKLPPKMQNQADSDIYTENLLKLLERIRRIIIPVLLGSTIKGTIFILTSYISTLHQLAMLCEVQHGWPDFLNEKHSSHMSVLKLETYIASTRTEPWLQYTS